MSHDMEVNTNVCAHTHLVVAEQQLAARGVLDRKLPQLLDLQRWGEENKPVRCLVAESGRGWAIMGGPLWPLSATRAQRTS